MCSPLPGIPIAEESRTHTVLLGKYLHLRQRKCSQYLILLRIFSLHLRNICSRKTAFPPPALNFLMDFVKASRSKIRILQGEIWRKTRKILAAGRMSSALFGYCVYYTTAPVILQRLRPRFWHWLLFFKIIIAFFLAPWYNMIKHCLK